MPRMNIGVSQEGKCLLDIVSWKLVSCDFCTSFALHKVKWASGGSRWMLFDLKHVSWYLAYVRDGLICYNAAEMIMVGRVDATM